METPKLALLDKIEEEKQEIVDEFSSENVTINTEFNEHEKINRESLFSQAIEGI